MTQEELQSKAFLYRERYYVRMSTASAFLGVSRYTINRCVRHYGKQKLHDSGIYVQFTTCKSICALKGIVPGLDRVTMMGALVLVSLDFFTLFEQWRALKHK